ncbi:MAG: hypothetical protein ABS36_16230 [Acidobacteria bacterium SCN 69-37]|nr:MAG: hypothetical protein ABS36_16230 [Acidobacteria bacterium SCN 69-37]
MRACPACGATYESSVKICPKDGTVLEGATGAVDGRLGQVLDGKYRLDAQIGQGGMGAIYRATHLMLDKPVAVKLIKAELVTSPDLVRRFQREARAAGNLNHPNIAAAYDLGQTQDGTLYIAMELVNGPSLKDVIRDTGPIAVDRAVRIMRQVGSALALAHRHNIIHRDLKPHNIMLATDGRHEVAKLLDFGIAKTFDEASTQLTATGFVLGTPQYMSPEQAAGRPIDGRSDLYSLGIILYEMLIGEVPFNDPSTPAVLVKHLTEVPAPPSRRRPDVAVSPVLEAIALRLLAKDPADRYQSADEFLAALPAETATAVPAVTSADDRTIALPPPGGGSPFRSERAETPPQPAAAFEATVAAPHQGGAPTVPATPAAAVPAASAAVPPVVPAAPARTPTPISVPVTAPATPAPAPARAAVPSPATEPWADRGPVAATEPRSTRNILVLAAVLLLVVSGVGYGAMRMGLFGSTDTPAEAATPGSGANLLEPGSVDPGASNTSIDTPASASTPSPQSTAAAATPPVSPSSAPASASTRAAAPAASGTNQAADRPATRQPAAAAEATPVATPATEPRTPAVFFRCAGTAQVCGALRSAMTDAFGRRSLRPVANEGAADVVVSATVTVVDESSEQLFGSTFVTRTYAIDLEGQGRGGDLVPMPPSSSLTFDAQVGQQRLNEQSRTLSATAADNVQAFWRTVRGQ